MIVLTPSSEILTFWLEVQNFKKAKTAEERAAAFQYILRKFLSPNGPAALGLRESEVEAVSQQDPDETCFDKLLQ